MSQSKPKDIDQSNIDLCVFEAQLSVELPQIGKDWAPAKWPPARVEVGDLVIGIGFPGANRRELENEAGKSDLMMVASVVSGNVASVSERHFVVADEGLERFMVNIGPSTYQAQFGGMSEGVFFKVVPSDSDLRLEVAGFLYEKYDVHQEGHDVHASLYVTHADFILPDGTIDHGRFGW